MRCNNNNFRIFAYPPRANNVQTDRETGPGESHQKVFKAGEKPDTEASRDVIVCTSRRFIASGEFSELSHESNFPDNFGA